MSLATHGFDLPIMPGSISPVLNLSQYDDARTFTAHLKDENGNPFTLPSGASAKLEGMNCKGVTFEINAPPSGSDITFTPKEAATDQPGLIAATLHIKSGNENISTLAVLLNVQKAGATKEEQARSPGFTDAIQNAVNAYFDGDPPFFELPSGGQSGQALLSDGADGAVWGEAGIPEAVKVALLACFDHIAAWDNGSGESYISDLHDALYPDTPQPPVSGALYSLTTATVFDGSNTIRTGAYPYLNNETGYICIMMEFTPTLFDDSTGRIVFSEVDSANHGLQFSLENSRIWGGGITYERNVQIASGTKYRAVMLAVTSTPAEWKTWLVNADTGTAVAYYTRTYSNAILGDSAECVLGENQYATTNKYVGTISKFALFQKAFSESQINTFLNSGVIPS